jgi:hypothetical protein
MSGRRLWTCSSHFNDVSIASIGFLLDKKFTLDAWNLHVQYSEW